MKILLLPESGNSGVRNILHRIVEHSKKHGEWKIYAKGLIDPVNADVVVHIGEVNSFVKISTSDWNFSIQYDFTSAGYTAGQYFKTIGFTTFGFAGLSRASLKKGLLQGFSRGVGRNDLNTLECKSIPDSLQNTCSSISFFLESLQKPAAILTDSDSLGVILVNHCKTLGISIPDEIAVIGTGNDVLCCEMTPVPLSSMKVDFSKVGEVIVNLMEKWRSGGISDTLPLVLSGEVVERESSRTYAFRDTLVSDIMRLILEEGMQMKSIGDLSARLPVSRRSMETHFKRATGKTLYEMMLQHRIRFACNLLRNENIGIRELSEKAGFASEQRFFAAFKQILGITPREYQKKISWNYDEEFFL